MDQIKNDSLAECVGLWLAEGSTNSRYEITFTNSCLSLIKLFYQTTKQLFKNEHYNTRIYVYTSDGSKPAVGCPSCTIKRYIHKRARKPYFIFRLASKELTSQWTDIVRTYLTKEKFFSGILRGFFAGEGNIHSGKRGVRVIRIAQKCRKPFVDNLLDYHGLKYSFTERNRNYILSNKRNWDIFSKYKLADLHPDKKKKFWLLYNSFKQEHYNKGEIYAMLSELLKTPMTSKALSELLNRSHARISESLVVLKKRGEVTNYRVGSVDYWTKDNSLVIISKEKNKYLSLLTNRKTTAELAKIFRVCWKSAFNRLTELRRLGLVSLGADKRWIITEQDKKIWAY